MGGWFEAAYSWRVMFYGPLPFIIVVWIIGILVIREHRDGKVYDVVSPSHKSLDTEDSESMVVARNKDDDGDQRSVPSNSTN